MKNDTQKYINDIKNLFPIYSQEEKNFFTRLKSTIDKESNCSNLSYQDCIERFGNPKDIIFDFYSEMDSEYLIKRMNKVYFIKRFLCIITLLIFIFILIGMIMFFKELHSTHINNCETIIKIINQIYTF